MLMGLLQIAISLVPLLLFLICFIFAYTILVYKVWLYCIVRSRFKMHNVDFNDKNDFWGLVMAMHF